MKLGAYDVPEQRLIPTVLVTLEEIYKVKKRDKIPSKDLAILLGFKYGTEPHYYRKIHSLQEYGLLDGKGIFQISELGEKVLHPRDDQEKVFAITKAVLNVPLWKEIYQKHGRQPRDDNFWAVLVDITKVDPATAKSNAGKILGWYGADIGHISEDIGKNIITGTVTMETKDLSSKDGNTKSMSQQMLQSNDDVQVISFDKYQVALPNGDLAKEWETLQEYMKIKLKNYKYEEQQRTGSDSTNQQ